MADKETPAEPTTPPVDAPAEPEPTFTQEDVNRMMGERAAQAKQAAAKEIAEQLGVPVDEAKAIIARNAEAEKAAMSEAERLAAEAKTDRDAAAQERAEARADRTSSKVELALTSAGVADPAIRSEVALLVMAKLNTAEEVTAEAAAEAVEMVKASLPQLFNSAPAPKSGEPRQAVPPSGGVAQQSAADRGRARALQAQGRTE